MRPRKTSKDYHDLAKENGFLWIGDEVSSTTTKTEWVCSKGHAWKTSYSNITSRKRGCPICKKYRLKKTIKDYYALAQERGFGWVGVDLPPTTAKKTSWQCPQGHEWEATYGNIRIGGECPSCRPSRSLARQDYEDAAEYIGIRFIGLNIPSNQQTKTKWECQKGHTWEATYHETKRNLKGCSVCNKAAPAPEYYHALAKKRGFKWVGYPVPKVMSTAWECPKGHTFKSACRNVEFGKKCPVCNKTYVIDAPAEFKEMVEQISKDFEIKNNNVLAGIQEMYSQYKTQFESLFKATGVLKYNWTPEKLKELIRFIENKNNVDSGSAYISKNTGISIASIGRWLYGSTKISYTSMNKLTAIAKEVGFYE